MVRAPLQIGSGDFGARIWNSREEKKCINRDRSLGEMPIAVDGKLPVERYAAGTRPRSRLDRRPVSAS